MDKQTIEDKLDHVYGKTHVAQSFEKGERKKLIEEKLKYLEGASQSMQNELVIWQKKHAKFFTECLELYKILNKPDVLFDDSPLSTHTMHRWIRLYLIKKGMGFLAKETHWFDSPNDIPDFAQKTKELKNWALRFSQDDARELSGAEKILSKGDN